MFVPAKITVNQNRLKGSARERAVSDKGGLVFTWAARGALGDRQSAFELTVFCEGQRVFETGLRETEKMECRLPEGALPRGKKLTCAVKIRDNAGELSAEAAEEFYIAAFPAHDRWITASNAGDNAVIYFQKDFAVQKPVKRAWLYACGLGYQEVSVNGRRLGDAHLDPAHTNYAKTAEYVCFPEIQADLKTGKNTIAARVASGWRNNGGPYLHGLKASFFGGTQLLLCLEIEYEDGEKQVVATDETWRAGFGPLVSAHLFDGTLYDANRRMELSECVLAEAPGGKLALMSVPPIREMGVFQPISISEPEKGKYILDFGQNLAGVLRVRLSGLSKGQRITLAHAEELNEDGLLYTDCLRGAKAKDEYVASGDANDLRVWQPEFTYHGFRYAMIEGLCPSEDTVTAVLLHTDMESGSFFRCGSAQINALQAQIMLTERDNMHSILTDCPQRDERMGWMNDATVRFEETPYNFDCARMFRKIVRDIMDEQGKDGAITCTAPFVYGYRPADPVCSSFLVAGMRGYLHFGDIETIRKAYPAYCAWENCLLSQSDQYIVNYSYYGDWAAPSYACEGGDAGAKSSVTPGEFMSTGYSYYNLVALSEMAKLLELPEESERHRKNAALVKEAMLKKWFDPETARVATGSMACQAFALWLDILPEAHRAQAAKRMRDALVSAGYAFTTGNLCTRYLLDMLAKYGYINEAYELLTRDAYPSFGFMRQHEATTVWERFELKKDPGMNSHNHPMYGAAGAFLYEYIAGVKPLDAGFRRFRVRPYLPDRLLSAQAGVETPFGRINVRWTKRYGEAHLYVDVPFGCECEAEFMGEKRLWTMGTHMLGVPLQ